MGRPTKKQLWKRRIAYSVTKMSEENVRKLGEAFAIGATVPEACDYADIAPSTYYLWCQKNPELSEYFDRMRQRLPLKAKENLARRIQGTPTAGDVHLSKWLIERRQPKEYGETVKVEHSGHIEDDAPAEDQQIVEEFHNKLKGNLRTRRIERAKQRGEL